jgi:hypothetical protein
MNVQGDDGESTGRERCHAGNTPRVATVCIRLDGSGVIMNIGALCPPPGLSLSLIGHNGCVLV